MASLIEINNELLQMVSKMRNSIKSTLYQESLILLNDFKVRSPEDTGEYKNLWIIGKPRNNSPNVIASTLIKNTDPKASVMEYGAKKNDAPWFYPGKKKKRTGKLIVRNGRVWAGGLNPGHSLTVGGAINNVLYNNTSRQLKIVKKIANNMMDAIR